MSRYLRRWGAVPLLAALWLASWAGQLVAQLGEITASGWSQFWASTFENWQSEFLQLAVQAVVIVGLAPLLFRRAEEDRERLERKVDRLTAHVADLLGGSTIIEARVDRLLELQQTQQQTTRRRRPPRLLPPR